MRRQLFAAGVAVALMLGAASPAMAKANHGKAKGHVNKPAKTTPAPKGPKANNKSGVSGGGAIAAGTFSAQARMKHQTKGHFNFDSTGLTLHCKAFVAFQQAPTSPATVEFTKCSTITGAEPNEVKTPAANVSVTFTDGAADAISFDFGGTTYAGTLTDGNIKIR